MKRTKIFIVFTFLLAFAVCASAQSSLYPNEIKGYEFFGKGKIKKLKPGISTKEDVIKIFGEACESIYSFEGCKYDENWNISFYYFEPTTAWFKTFPDGNSVKYLPKSKYVGKIQTIQLSALKNYPFAKKLLAKNFKTEDLELRTKPFSSPEQPGFVLSTIYYDSSGLNYFVCQSEDDKDFRKGDLLRIDYRISEKQQSKIFVEQK